MTELEFHVQLGRIEHAASDVAKQATGEHAPETNSQPVLVGQSALVAVVGQRGGLQVAPVTVMSHSQSAAWHAACVAKEQLRTEHDWPLK